VKGTIPPEAEFFLPAWDKPAAFVAWFGGPSEEHAMTIEAEKIKAIFLDAIEKATPAERDAFVTEACAGDSACRRRLEALLQAHDEPGGLLDGLTIPPEGPGDGPLSDSAPDSNQAEPLPETVDLTSLPAGPSTPPGAAQHFKALRRLLADSDPLQPAVGSPTPGDATPSTGPRGEDTAIDTPDVPVWRDQYELLEKLGRGGMGVVYKARQLGLNRLVALKTILGGADATADERARFRREAESMARLRHPHIVQVYAVGERDGCPFFSMELLEGGNLARKIAGWPQPARQAAAWLEALARAMHYAHEQGVVHRDLKPGNVVLTADGVPKITDFGLARQLPGEPGVSTPGGQTADGVAVGTVEYMAPEQAAGRTKEIGPLSDVYALGAILYELLTGRAPFQRDDYLKTLHELQERDPPRPRTLNPQADAELEAVCLKCLEKKPQQRYPSAEALADDLARWLRGEATLARPRRWPVRVGRTIRRHPLLSTAIALAGIAAVLVPVVAYVRDPARHVEYVQRHLREGRKVTLLGETGRPSWFRANFDPPVLSISNAADGAFSVESDRIGLVELLTDPQNDAYRLSAEVRFDSGSATGAVGVFFAHSQYEIGAGQPVHYFCAVEFLGFENLPPRPPQRKGGPVRTGNPVKFISVRQIDWGIRAGPVVGLREDVSVNTPPHTWHKILVSVTPQTVEARWDGQPIGEWSRAELTKDFRKTLAGLASSGTVSVPMDAQMEFPCRGALGLMVHMATGSFRSVIIEPLNNGNR
jgi:serine/threonine-protein kinase